MKDFQDQVKPELLQNLQERLSIDLKTARRHHKYFRIFRSFSYGFFLLYLVFVITMAFTSGTIVDKIFGTKPIYSVGHIPSFWEQYRVTIIVGSFVVLVAIVSHLYIYFYNKYQELDNRTIRTAIEELFPQSKARFGMQILPSHEFKKSLLFKHLNYDSDYTPLSYGIIDFKSKPKVKIADLYIPYSKNEQKLLNQRNGQNIIVFKQLINGIFTKKSELSQHFRGLYIEIQLEKEFQGSLLILPDHWEKRLETFATYWQSLCKQQGLSFTHLEDVRFEKVFQTYTNDPILARCVLTPRMMQSLTRIHDLYGKDMFISTNKNIMTIAVSLPYGVFDVNTTKTDENFVSNLYQLVAIAQQTPHLLNLK